MTASNIQYAEGPQIKKPLRTIPLGAAKTLSQQDHGRCFGFDTAAGSIATLPQATGSGCELEFVVIVTATSNSHIVKVGNATDIIQGTIMGVSDTAGTAIAWLAGATDDTITWNRTTTGLAAIGNYIKLKDIKAGVWGIVASSYSANGTEATPFSATVS